MTTGAARESTARRSSLSSHTNPRQRVTRWPLPSGTAGVHLATGLRTGRLPGRSDVWEMTWSLSSPDRKGDDSVRGTGRRVVLSLGAYRRTLCLLFALSSRQLGYPRSACDRRGNGTGVPGSPSRELACRPPHWVQVHASSWAVCSSLVVRAGHHRAEGMRRSAASSSSTRIRMARRPHW